MPYLRISGRRGNGELRSAALELLLTCLNLIQNESKRQRSSSKEEGQGRTRRKEEEVVVVDVRYCFGFFWVNCWDGRGWGIDLYDMIACGVIYGAKKYKVSMAIVVG